MLWYACVDPQPTAIEAVSASTATPAHTPAS